MYFPYLRGKQFELIALRELSNTVDKSKISPVIEPVKDSSTLKTTLTKLFESEINFNFIINPEYGDLVGDTGRILNILKSDFETQDSYQISVIVDNQPIEYFIQLHQDIIDIEIAYNGISLIHNNVRSDLQDILDIFNNDDTIVFNIVSFEKTNRRYYRRLPTGTRVELDDYFAACEKNADYLRVGESSFSEEHLHYSGEGFEGFSDFLTLGDSYSDSGFLPYAVAIHISYKADDDSIRVKHFVSDSNDDPDDTAGKYMEALEKLINWCDHSGHTTSAIVEFRDLHDRGHFPGLGSLKKLSIINHIELVLSLI